MSLSIIVLLSCLYDTAVTANTESKPSTTDRHVPSPETIFQLTERLDEMTKHVEDLKRFRDSDTREMAKMNEQLERFQTLRANDQHVMNHLTKRIAELEHLRDKDQYKTTQLTMRVTELERECNMGRQVISDGSNLITLAKHGNASLSDKTADTSGVDEDKSEESESDQGQAADKYPLRHTRVNPVTEVVAFHTQLTHNIDSLSNDQTIKYNHIITSTGGAHYSNNTGVFTCTMAGVHVFTWSVKVEPAQYVCTNLERNNGALGTNLAGDHNYPSHSASTVAVHLNVGDEVWIRRVCASSSTVRILRYSSMFTGFRLGI